MYIILCIYNQLKVVLKDASVSWLRSLPSLILVPLKPINRLLSQPISAKERK